MAEPMGAAELQRLPDGGDAESLTRVQRAVKVRLLDRANASTCLRGGKPASPRQTETNYATVAKIDRELRRFQRVRTVARRTEDDAPFDTKFVFAAL